MQLCRTKQGSTHIMNYGFSGKGDPAKKEEERLVMGTSRNHFRRGFILPDLSTGVNIPCSVHFSTISIESVDVPATPLLQSSRTMLLCFIEGATDSRELSDYAESSSHSLCLAEHEGYRTYS